MKLKLYISFLAGIILFGACKRSSDKPMWDVDLLTPLVQSSLTISNLIKDTANVKVDKLDNSIKIVNHQLLAEVTLDSLVSLNTDPYTETFGLDELVLPAQSDTTIISIRTIVDQLKAHPTDINVVALGYYMEGKINAGEPVDLDGLPPFNFSNYDVDISKFFEEANIATGTLTVKVINNLPADIANLNFTFKNKVGGAIIANHNFTNIVMGANDSYSEDLDGKTVKSELTADMNPLELVGYPNTTVTWNQAIVVIMSISNITVNNATAVFQTQDIMTKQKESSLTTLGDVEIKNALIQSGSFNLYIESTLQDIVYVDYRIPKAVKNGVSFDTTIAVPKATVVAGSVVPGKVDVKLKMDGYELDFTGVPGHDTVNTFYYEMTGRIVYSGSSVYLSSTDYITATVTGEKMSPSLVEGYLGQKTFNIGPGVLDLPIFRGIESGTLNFEDIKMEMVVENGFGIDANVAITDMTSYNSNQGQAYTLTPSPNFTINRSPAINSMERSIGNFGSGATSLINVLPDKVSYAATVTTNPGGNTGTYPDFAQNTALMKAYLDIEMPLSIMASELVLVDTAMFNTAVIKKKNVNSGTFKVFVNNGFPLSASLMMYFMDQYGVITDSVKSLPDAIMAAPLNASNRVVERRSSEVAFDASEQMMDNLYRSSFVIFKIKFTTLPASSFVKIYSDYSIDFKMVGDMDYSVHKK